MSRPVAERCGCCWFGTEGGFWLRTSSCTTHAGTTPARKPDGYFDIEVARPGVDPEMLWFVLALVAAFLLGLVLGAFA